jgi:hypothetical protein
MNWINTLRWSESFRIPTSGWLSLCKSFRAAGAAWIAILALISLGCSSGGSPSGVNEKSEAVHITKAAQHISKYTTETKGKIPTDTSEMKDWAANNNITEDDLRSTRDHEPYEVHEVNKGGEKQLIVTEKTGAKGKKFIWKSRSQSPMGMEQSQAEIDAALKSDTGARGGRAPSR